MNDVFISYARPDAPVALEIAELLRQQGQSVFLDADTLVAGEISRRALSERCETRRSFSLFFQKTNAGDDGLKRNLR